MNIESLLDALGEQGKQAKKLLNEGKEKEAEELAIIAIKDYYVLHREDMAKDLELTDDIVNNIDFGEDNSATKRNLILDYVSNISEINAGNGDDILLLLRGSHSHKTIKEHQTGEILIDYPRFAYLTKEDVRHIFDKVNPDYKNIFETEILSTISLTANENLGKLPLELELRLAEKTTAPVRNHLIELLETHEGCRERKPYKRLADMRAGLAKASQTALAEVDMYALSEHYGPATLELALLGKIDSLSKATLDKTDPKETELQVVRPDLELIYLECPDNLDLLRDFKVRTAVVVETIDMALDLRGPAHSMFYTGEKFKEEVVDAMAQDLLKYKELTKSLKDSQENKVNYAYVVYLDYLTSAAELLKNTSASGAHS